MHVGCEGCKVLLLLWSFSGVLFIGPLQSKVTKVCWRLIKLGLSHLSFIVSGEDFRTALDEEGKFLRRQRINFAKALIGNITIHYAVGMRGFFLALCVGGWTLSPAACLAVTSTCVIYMFVSDHSFIKLCGQTN